MLGRGRRPRGRSGLNVTCEGEAGLETGVWEQRGLGAEGGRAVERAVERLLFMQ